MKSFSIIIMLLLLGCSISCTAQKKEAISTTEIAFLYNTDSLLHHVRILSSDVFEGRRTGTTGALKAKDYIVSKLQKLQVKPLVENYEQSFSFSSRKKDYQGVNILGLISGSDYPEKYIVISAHYDHEGIKNGQIYNGADDDASGVSAMLAFAEYFQKHQPKHSVILAFFDAEELGLQGSRYYVDNTIEPLESIKLNMNMDMVSRNDKNELYITGARDNEAFKNAIENQDTSEGFKFLMGHDGKDGKQNWTFSSDHGSFFRKGIPFLYFGVEDHNDYHRPTDDYENIHPEFYKLVVQNIISLFTEIDALNL
ncbi:M20/M25/M40 family metallo-hydrolase [Hanstruepera ponticola]|uniref:M20/M25/M40 family metallo-hydrolase n=1 Tax=Hanstruepera ponticola TaxID=2042995 RepID=UPI001E45FC6D|nr:M20/M25/M40 family metallo-hydrolase [Hanstruepera ponticola]